MNARKLAILCDFAEENWPSMDLAAQMLGEQLRANHSDAFEAVMLQPAFKRRVSFSVHGRNLDRLINRMRDYPRWLSKRVDQFDLFHLADHSYSQLVHVLPAERTGVFCHDLDTFRCLLDPRSEPRPKWFRVMARRILEGMQKARVVFHSTSAVREQILRHGLIDPARLVQAPCGVAPEFSTTPASRQLPQQIADVAARGFLLHVGSCIPRKRIDVLLDVFADVSSKHPDLRLVQAGGEWTIELLNQIERLGIAPRVIQLQRQERATIAELYRRSRALLVTSEAEGFGLPLVEGLACGAIVVASDIPVLREVGGAAAVYCHAADVHEWSKTVSAILDGKQVAPPLDARLEQSQRFSWKAQADIIAATYGRWTNR